VNLKEARRRLSDLVRAAEKGESIVLTRRGRKVARIEGARERATKRLPSLAEFRASIVVKGKPLSQTVIDARREARY
jgi:prevent-host-death family protein